MLSAAISFTKLKQLSSFTAIIILLLFVGFVSLPGNSLLWCELQNFGHTPLFGCIAVLCLYLLRQTDYFKHRHPLKMYFYAAMIALGLGAGIELIQLFTPRTASVIDFLRDALGIFSVLSVCIALDLRRQADKKHIKTIIWQAGLYLVALLLLVASLFPLLPVSIAYWQRNQAFPVIINFSKPWSEVFLHKQHVHMSIVDTPARLQTLNGRKIAEMKFDKTGRYQGIAIIDPYPDWSAYHHLSVKVYLLATSSIYLVLRISDQQHNQEYTDRYNHAYELKPGWNHLQVSLDKVKRAPAGRLMNMRHIHKLMLFRINAGLGRQMQPTVKLYMRRIRLLLK